MPEFKIELTHLHGVVTISETVTQEEVLDDVGDGELDIITNIMRRALIGAGFSSALVDERIID